MCARTFRRYVGRYEEEGLAGLIDKRLEQASQRRAPVDEVMALVELYLKDVRRPAFSAELLRPALEQGSASVP